MFKLLATLIFLGSLMTASAQKDSCEVLFEQIGNYPQAKLQAEKTKNLWKKKYYAAPDSLKPLILDSAGKDFTHLLVRVIFPHWRGTSWAYGGYTSQPQKGEVACGYLVSTTLLHIGVKVNRYKMAQKAPEKEAKIVNCGREPIKVANDTCWHYFNQLPTGLYFVGLESHVGYLYVTKKNLLFLHSNYTDESYVKAEYATCSKAFNWSGKYYLCSISGNREFIRKWLLGYELKIVE